jgi:monothiol glutaredoxin
MPASRCAVSPAARSRSSRPCGVDTKALKTVNVLEDDGIRQGIKEYSNWPTIPQLYVRGEFIGGSDIMMEMYENGELQQVVNGSPA